MNSKVLELLEFNKILAMLADKAVSVQAKERILALKPMNNKHMIQDSITETTEAVSVIMYKGNIPVSEMGDVVGLLGMARKGRCLSMKELLMIKRTLTITREVKLFISNDMPEGLKIIPEIAELLVPVIQLEQDIEKSILSEDEMSDSASSALRNIRREIKNKNEMIKSRLQKMVSTKSTHLQDAIVTMRNGRYVIPVKREYANMFPGMVHDQSSTGATLFIEPQAVVNLNNELRQLSMDEEAEITRILQLFSSRVAEHYNEIENNQKLLAELDFINAKGRLSRDMDASEPHLNEDNYLEIKTGRHPLIASDKVVPINIGLGKEWSTLLITGPNTGGKTVTLKTVGLLCLMAQSGLHIPADESSEMPVLNNIFADIGDEQSIEQSLSTFSSHMKNIVDIFSKTGKGDLVLLDELGSGTDPSEGAALGIAELERLRELGALVIATTHYTELKKYALSTENVENASMEFNVKTLSPTYKLRVGLPGKSNAFEISKKLGLDEGIIDRATELLGENQLSFEAAVSRVEADQKKTEIALEEANKARTGASEKLASAEASLVNAKAEADRIIEEARSQARQMLRDAQGTIDEISKELRAIKDKNPGAGFNDGHIAGGVASSRGKLRNAEGEYKSSIKVSTIQTGKIPEPEMLKFGMAVKYTKLNQNGIVETLPDARGNLTIRVGSMKLNVNIKDLIIIASEPAGNKEKTRKKYGALSFNKTKTIKTEINLIGKNLDEAIDLMNKYLDDAFLAGLKTVHVIHGRGEKILMNGLRAEMKKNKHVKSFKSATYDNGGEGCTVVELIDRK